MTSTVQLLGADRAQSVIASIAEKCLHHCYDPFGQTVNRSPANAGFNGAYQESPTGHYMLGNGYRAYSSILRRFLSPDSISPFGRGGFNAYAYCKGDPMNASDPTGHWSKISTAFMSMYEGPEAITPFRILHQIGDPTSEAIGEYLTKEGDGILKARIKSFGRAIKDAKKQSINISEDTIEMLTTRARQFNALASGPRGEPAILTISNATFKGNAGISKDEASRLIRGVLGLGEANITKPAHLEIRKILLEHAVRKSGQSIKTEKWFRKALRLNEEIRKSL